jgi:hypothetical protein
MANHSQLAIRALAQNLGALLVSSTLITLSGCISAPSPGNNADYQQLLKGNIDVKPQKKPRFITPKALNKVQRKSKNNTNEL